MPSAETTSNAAESSGPRRGAQAKEAAGREEAEAAGGCGGEERREGASRSNLEIAH